MTDPLANLIRDGGKGRKPWRFGTVAATSPLTIRLSGDTTGASDISPVNRNASYTAVLNDFVLLAAVDGGYIVICKVV